MVDKWNCIFFYASINLNLYKGSHKKPSIWYIVDLTKCAINSVILFEIILYLASILHFVVFTQSLIYQKLYAILFWNLVGTQLNYISVKLGKKKQNYVTYKNWNKENLKSTFCSKLYCKTKYFKSVTESFCISYEQ